MPRNSQDRLLDEHLHTLVAQGNHDALIELGKRYHKHSRHLVSQLLNEYPSTGITKRELNAVCDSHFHYIVIKFNATLCSSFLTFWKESAKNAAMNYLIENSYNGGAFGFRGVISFNEANEDSLCYGEIIAEKDDERIDKKRIFEIRSHLYRYKNCFTDLEFGIVNLILSGYSYAELVHGNMMSRATIRLTFNKAMKKLKTLVNNSQQNTK